MPGEHVVELELIATAAGARPAAEQRTEPVEQFNGAEVVDRHDGRPSARRHGTEARRT